MPPEINTGVWNASGRLQFRHRGFKFGDAGRERLVLLTSLLRHVAHGFEILAGDDIHIAQKFLSLSTDHGFRLAPDAFGRPSGFRHELGKVVKQSIRRLGHHRYRGLRRKPTMAIEGANRKIGG